MKKWLIKLSLFILFLLIISAYLFIPSKLIVSDYVLINKLSENNYRYLHHPNQWTKWWPGFKADNHYASLRHSSSFFYKGYTYQFFPTAHNTLKVRLLNKKLRINSKITIIPLSLDSIAIQWQLSFPSSIYPLQRIIKYQQAKKIKNNIDLILDSLQNFLQKQANIYDIKIEQTVIKDSSLITIDSIYQKYPGTSAIYILINRLKKYIGNQRATAINYPMLNISKIDSTHFKATVAIPTNRALKNKGNLVFKRLIPGIHLLTAKVKGGKSVIKYGHKKIEKFIDDNHNKKVAIPYEILVTDRSKEPDTAKWITRICYPIY